MTRTLIGCPSTVTEEWQKIGFDPICYTERRLWRNGSWNGNGATEFFTYAT